MDFEFRLMLQELRNKVVVLKSVPDFVARATVKRYPSRVDTDRRRKLKHLTF